jgi:hypothetical protein
MNNEQDARAALLSAHAERERCRRTRDVAAANLQRGLRRVETLSRERAAAERELTVAEAAEIDALAAEFSK